MTGPLCQARGRDGEGLRLLCLLRPEEHVDDWHRDMPDVWWLHVPDSEEECRD